jgi:DNA polymerase-3 subunit beta
MKITFSKTHLKAVSRYMAKTENRYYLNGVYVEASPQETRLIATDGYAMGILREQKAGDDLNDVSAIVYFIIPDTAIKTMLAWKSASKVFTDITVIVPDDYATNASAEFRADFAGNVLVFKRIDGKFPDYRRVIPEKTTGELAFYDPDLLVRVKRASEDLGNRKGEFSLNYNGNSGALAQINTETIAVIMPMRTDINISIDATWARGALAGIDTVISLAE